MIKQVVPDERMTRALQKTVHKKQLAAASLSTEFYEAKFTLLYDALRILLEILALKNGLKIYSHECYTAFLKETVRDSRLGDQFDALRKVRNNINYYGEELTTAEAESLIEQCIQCIKSMEAKK